MKRKIWILVLCSLLYVLSGCASRHEAFYFSHGHEEVTLMEIYYIEYSMNFFDLKEAIINKELSHLSTIDEAAYEDVINEINGMLFTETIFLRPWVSIIWDRLTDII